jgi:hypothetical protein
MRIMTNIRAGGPEPWRLPRVALLSAGLVVSRDSM